MSLEIDGFWESGFWATTFWADGFWREGAFVPSVIKGSVKIQLQLERTEMTLQSEGSIMDLKIERTTMTLQ